MNLIKQNGMFPILDNQLWKYFIGWNKSLNYDIEGSTILVYYNFAVAHECRRLKRPIYLPFNYQDINFKIVFEDHDYS